MHKGAGISKDQLSNEGEPCILYGELYTKYNSETIKEVISRTNIDNAKLVRSKANDIIIPCSGETAEDISTARCVLKGNILLGSDLNIIRLYGYDGSFMSYQLSGKRKFDIARVAQGVSVVHLYGEHLRGVKTYNPCLEEQKKIAKLLTLLDESIETQNKIIEDLKKLKSGIADKLITTIKGESVPLSEICDIVKGKQVNGEFLAESGDYYVMNGGIEPSGFYNKYNVEGNTISISEGGNSCGYVQFNTRPFWSGGHCYSIQNIKETVDKKFIYHYLKSKEVSLMKLRIGSGLPNIQKKDLSNFKVLIPTLKQQQTIAGCLSLFERKVNMENKLLSVLQDEKRYLLRQMFI